MAKIGITKEDRDALKKYCTRYSMTDGYLRYLSNKNLKSSKGKRVLYAFFTDKDDIDYKTSIGFVRKKNTRPTYREAINKRDKFIVDAVRVHGGKYTYENLEDNPKKRDQVTITCKKHGDFTQLAWNHTNGRRGCPTCAKERRANRMNFKRDSDGFEY